MYRSSEECACELHEVAFGPGDLKSDRDYDHEIRGGQWLRSVVLFGASVR